MAGLLGLPGDLGAEGTKLERVQLRRARRGLHLYRSLLKRRVLEFVSVPHVLFFFSRVTRLNWTSQRIHLR